MPPYCLKIIFLLFFLLCAFSPTPAAVARILPSITTLKNTARKLQKSQPQGGSTGNPFDDFSSFNASTSSTIASISALNISYGEYINSIEVEYHLTNMSYSRLPVRGTSLNPVTINLRPEEHISRIEGSTNDIAVTQLTIYVKQYDGKEKVYGPYGKQSENPFSIQGYVVGFYGRSESFLSNLGVYYLNELMRSEEYGPAGDGGSKFDEHTDIHSPPIVGISKVTFWHGDFLNGMQAEYILLGGRIVYGEMHGGKDATVTTTITLENGEKINNATFGHIKDFGFISMVTLTVKRISGKTEVVGPFGDKGVQSYSLAGNILGFYGHSGSYMNRLGFYYEI